ncbi:MAG: hypothetical protein V1922_00760 [bacterium]
MKKIFLFAICLFVYLFILISVPVQIFPEFFFYPWLVAKGLVQYKDFFDHHGFITNLLLAPFARNINSISLIFIGTQVVQFILIAQIVYKKIKQPALYLFILILYFSFQFTVVQQTMWFDSWMAFFLITGWFFFEKKREHIGWIFVACATMIKPTALIFLFPIFLYSKNKKSIVGFLFLWVVALTYFMKGKAVGEMLRQLLVFNYAYVTTVYKVMLAGVQYKLLLCIFATFVIVLCFAVRRKKRNSILISMTFFSFIFYFFGFSKLNFALFVPFFTLLISEVLGQKKINKKLLIVLSLFLLIIMRDAYKTYLDVRHRHVYLSSIVLSEAKQVSNLISEKKGKNVLVVGNRVELYYLLDVLPNEFTPLHFPWVEKVYGTEVNLKNIQYIIIPKKPNEYESINPAVKNAIKYNFRQIGQTASYAIWRYNRT